MPGSQAKTAHGGQGWGWEPKKTNAAGRAGQGGSARVRSGCTEKRSTTVNGSYSSGAVLQTDHGPPHSHLCVARPGVPIAGVQNKGCLLLLQCDIADVARHVLLLVPPAAAQRIQRGGMPGLEWQPRWPKGAGERQKNGRRQRGNKAGQGTLAVSTAGCCKERTPHTTQPLRAKLHPTLHQD